MRWFRAGARTDTETSTEKTQCKCVEVQSRFDVDRSKNRTAKIVIHSITITKKPFKPKIKQQINKNKIFGCIRCARECLCVRRLSVCVRLSLFSFCTGKANDERLKIEVKQSERKNCRMPALWIEALQRLSTETARIANRFSDRVSSVSWRALHFEKYLLFCFVFFVSNQSTCSYWWPLISAIHKLILRRRPFVLLIRSVSRRSAAARREKSVNRRTEPKISELAKDTNWQSNYFKSWMLGCMIWYVNRNISPSDRFMVQ